MEGNTHRGFRYLQLCFPNFSPHGKIPPAHVSSLLHRYCMSTLCKPMGSVAWTAPKPQRQQVVLESDPHQSLDLGDRVDIRLLKQLSDTLYFCLSASLLFSLVCFFYHQNSLPEGFYLLNQPCIISNFQYLEYILSQPRGNRSTCITKSSCTP